MFVIRVEEAGIKPRLGNHFCFSWGHPVSETDPEVKEVKGRAGRGTILYSLKITLFPNDLFLNSGCACFTCSSGFRCSGLLRYMDCLEMLYRAQSMTESG